MYYFAYASNLSRRQMRERCPGAKPLFRARLPHHKLIFTGWSRKWRGGTATVRSSTGDVVAGALYEVSEADLRVLDRQEGIPGKYDRLKIKVVTEDEDFVEALTHVRVDPADETKPTAEYLAIIQEGYKDWGMASGKGQYGTLRPGRDS